ncbi:MAG TPA: transposase [Chthoniobacterales bacterium]
MTSTIVEWLPVFTSAKTCDILVETLAWYQANKGLKIYAWVILENHFHAILQHDELPRVMADLKKFIARKLVSHWEGTRQEWLVHQLAHYKLKHKTTSQHQVWQEGYHPQQISDDAMMLQKLEYLHMNPVRRGLVVEREHWRYSSAHVWLPGAKPVLRCDEWR